MNHFNRTLGTAAVALALLGGCEKETLSVGELRCRGVSCGPHMLEQLSYADGSEESGVMLPPAVATVTEMALPCPFTDHCSTIAHLPPAMRLLDRDGGASPIVAVSMEGYDRPPADEPAIKPELALWVARYQDGDWHGATLVEPDDASFNRNQVLGAIAIDPASPGEAIVLVTELRVRNDSARRLRAFRFDGNDELDLLFEDPSAAAVHDAAVIDGDVVVVGIVQGNFEVTRYAADGTPLWRQASLASSEPWLPTLSNAHARIGVFDEDRIAVLVPRDYMGIYEILVLDGSGEKLSAIRLLNSLATTVRLATAGDKATVARDGYLLQRLEPHDGELQMRTVSRERKLYYELEAFGLDITPSGWTYFATQDGERDTRVELIERVSPDFGATESISLSDGDGDATLLLSEGSTLRVAPDGRRAFIVDPWSFAEVTLPPLPE